MSVYTGPTPPVIGTRVIVVLDPSECDYIDCQGHEAVVTGFDPFDGAVFVDTGEVVANHLGPNYSSYAVRG